LGKHCRGSARVLKICTACLVLLTVSSSAISNVLADENYSSLGTWPENQWFFANPQGVAVDSSGSVYVVDTNNHSIQKFKSDGTCMQNGKAQEMQTDILGTLAT
jgi:hypothetical protein